MLELEVTPGWDKVPRIEKDTPLRGGPGGELNAQAQALANRTEQLNADATAISVRRYVKNPVDGITVNQAGIAAAVEAAYAAGVPLSWPAGLYVSDASIPRFHDVRHIGPGVIKRGNDLYPVSPKDSNSYKLYVATTGSAGNDGLSAAQPMLTIQQAFNVVQSWGTSLNGTLTIDVAAGTYGPGNIITGVYSRRRIIVQGAPLDASGQPTTIIDGQMSAGSGIWFGEGMYVHAKRLKSKNFGSGEDGSVVVGSGFVASNKVAIYYEDCWAENCGWTGFNNNTACRVLFTRGGSINCYNFMLNYAGTTYSIGYNGSPTANRVTVIGCSPAAVMCQDGSNGHIDFVDFVDCPTSINLAYACHTAIWGCTFTGGTRPIECGMDCSWGENPAYPNTYTGTIRSYWGAGSRDKKQFQYDYTNKRFLLGADDDRAALSKLHVVNGNAPYNPSLSGQSLTLESSGNTAFQMAAGSSFFSAFWFGDETAYNRWEIRHQAGVLIGRIAGTAYYRWRSTDFAAQVDGALSCGTATFRWSTVYASTGTINTSDKDAKDSIQDIEAAALRAVRRISFKQFKFKDAVAAKGDGARWHFGVIAQQVKAAFEAEGLDPFAYGVLCFDEWPDQFEPVYAKRTVIDADGSERIEEYDTGEQRLIMAAGSRYGVRYEELFSLKLAAMELN